MGNRLGDLISRGEGGYNSFNRGSAGDARGATIDFSRMTMGELQDAQHLPRRDPDRLFAVGKYQIIPGTMDGAVSALGIGRNERVTPEMQERIFSDYLIVTKRPDIHGYITGKPGVSLHHAQEAVAAEWASVADPDTGRSKYGGIGNNRASISADQVAGALNAMRQEYQEALRQGKSPAEAWRQVAPHEVTQPGREATRDATADGVLRQGERGDEVKAMQETLTKLGYRDAQGRELVPDAHFGARTEDALRAFQRDHGLKDDGIAGPKTLEALKIGERQPLISDASHPGNPMYRQALSQLEQLGPQAGCRNQQEMQNAAASLAFEAKVSGLSRIDHVALGTNGQGLFAVQGRLDDPGHHRVYADREAAAQQPVERSSQQWQQDAQQQQSQQAQAQQREPARMSM